MVKAVAAFALLVDQMRSPQQAEVFRNRWPGDRKRLGDLSGRLTAFAQQVEHRSASRVGQGAERRLR
jgi:hypothetical protein